MTSFALQLYRTILPYETRRKIHKLTHLKGYRNLRTVVHPSAQGDFSLKAYDENRCIFIHITKTAGTSIAASLFGYLPYHYTAIEYRVIYGRKTFNNYYKFAFVRNPWDRVYSAYRYLKSGGWNDNDRFWSENNLAEFNDFNQFIENWLNKHNIKKHIHFAPQYQFICDKNDKLLVDYLAYFETINEDYTKIARRLNIEANIGHHNANPADNYLNVYNERSRSIVADIYSKDISMFGYNFNGIKQRRIISR